MSNPIKWTAAFASPISNPNSTTSPGTLNWMPGQSLLGASSTAAPSLASYYQDKIWCIHNDGSGNFSSWSAIYDFNSWQGEYQIGALKTDCSIALGAFKDQLWAIAAGTNIGQNNLYYITSTNGIQWSSTTAPVSSSNHTDAGPSFVVLNDVLYCVYKGHEDPRVYCTATSDGGNWSNAIAISGSVTSSGPALCVFQGKLWCVYRGTDEGFYTTTSDDGQTWSTPVWANSQYMDSPPVLSVVLGQQGNPDALLCVYGDSQGNNRFCYTYNTSGDPGDWQWGGTTSNISRVNGTGMGLAVWNDIIFGAYMST